MIAANLSPHADDP